MWNYFEETVLKLQELPQFSSLEVPVIIENLFPDVQYIWIVRRNKVRQAVSWAIAAQTGIYAKWQEEFRQPLQEPVFDFDQIDDLHDLILEGEAGWQNYFESNQIEPFKVYFEDLVEAYEGTGKKILDSLDVPYPDNLAFGQRKMKKQGTSLNEDWAEKYRSLKGLSSL